MSRVLFSTMLLMFFTLLPYGYCASAKTNQVSLTFTQAIINATNLDYKEINKPISSAFSESAVIRMTLIYLTNPADTPASALGRVTGSMISSIAKTSLGQKMIAKLGDTLHLQNALFTQIAWLPTASLRFSLYNPVPGVAIVAIDLMRPDGKAFEGVQKTIQEINYQLSWIDSSYQMIYKFS